MKKIPQSCVNTAGYKRINILFVLSVLLFSSVFNVWDSAAQTSNQDVQGHVYDVNGAPLPGTTVTIKGTYLGVTADGEGRYMLSNVPADAVLSFSFIGMKPMEMAVGGQSVVDVYMEYDAIGLEEVVAIGYGVQKKKLSTGATTQIKGNDLFDRNTTGALSALQGLAPGVQIAKNSGQPGADYKITIRGLGTNGDATPLYVVDGIPTTDIGFLSTSDIESLDVLKDAASAAIYGARAANGVILITTKKGRVGSANISFDAYYGWQNVYKKLDMLNAQEYAMIINESWVTAGNSSLYDPTNPNGFAQNVPNWDKIQDGTWKGTDWLDETRVKNAPMQNYSLNITGGTEQSVYSIGVSYTEQKGTMGKPVESNYNRYTARVNSDHTLIKKGKLEILKVGENLNYSHVKNNTLPTGFAYYNFLTNFIQMHPFLPVYDDEGAYHTAIPWSTQVNPVGHTDYFYGQNETKTQKILGNIYAEIQPVKGLKWRNSFGIDNGYTSYRKFTPQYYLSTSSDGMKDNSEVTQYIGTTMSWIYESTLNYNFSIRDRHKFDVLVGTSLQRTGLGETVTGRNSNSTFDDFKHAYLDNTPVISPSHTAVGGYPETEGSIASVFARLNYDINETYLFTAVIRGDGSSNFAKKNRWGYFPSFSAGWILTNESFMQGSRNWLNFMKLRASWGQNGNHNIGAYAYLSTITFTGTGASYFFGPDKANRTLGAYPDKIANHDLKWETSEQIDIGFDANMLSGRLGLNFDWYQKTTKDWLVEAPALASWGTGAPMINGGDVRNRGIEVVTSWNDRVGDFNYGVSANFSYNKNKVTRIANADGFLESSSEGYGTLQRAMVGQPFGVFWGRKTDGIFQNEEEIQNYKNSRGELLQPDARPGDFRYVDVNGDGVINNDDRTNIGKATPDFTYGVTLSADYKGFDLSVIGTGVAGNQNAMLYMMSYSGGHFRGFKSNYTTEILNRWHGEGTSNTVPRVTNGATNFNYFSDYFVRDAGYFRISSITLGYDLARMFRNFPLQQLRVYCSVQNLYTFTKYPGMDPEVGFGNDMDSEGMSPSWTSGIDLGFYPTPRTFLVGVNIKF